MLGGGANWTYAKGSAVSLMAMPAVWHSVLYMGEHMLVETTRRWGEKMSLEIVFYLRGQKIDGLDLPEFRVK
jgi:hypothetical protein